MNFIDATTVSHRLKTEPLIDALSRMFAEGCTTPVRHAHTIPVPGTADGSLLLMPSWRVGSYLGTKLVTVYPGNSALGLAAVASIYILMDSKTGTPLALMDGDTLTARRTAATSALAARYLANPKSKRLLIAGSGRIARELALTHAEARPELHQITIWSRSTERAQTLVQELKTLGLSAEVTNDLGASARQSDIISAATLSTEPLLRRDWIRPGTHIDLVGAFRPGMREADDALVADSRIVCDTLAGVLAEADDVRIPLRKGLIHDSALVELSSLCRGTAAGRQSAEEITLFKSVGAAIEDLAAAVVVYETA
jgi:ornithine cyclodeaminase